VKSEVWQSGSSSKNNCLASVRLSSNSSATKNKQQKTEAKTVKRLAIHQHSMELGRRVALVYDQATDHIPLGSNY
jgi:hypothetical protein